MAALFFCVNNGVEIHAVPGLDGDDAASLLAKVTQLHPRLEGLVAEPLGQGLASGEPPFAIEHQRAALNLCAALERQVRLAKLILRALAEIPCGKWLRPSHS